MTIKRIAFVALSVAVFAASSCKAQAQTANDEAEQAGRLAAELADTFAICQERIGSGEYAKFNAWLRRNVGEEAAANNAVFHRERVAVHMAKSPRSRAEVDRTQCVLVINEMQEELSLSFRQALWLASND